MNQQKENRINAVVETAMKNLNESLDVNTVVGKPIKGEDGSIIIPITKIMLGILTGGGEYGKKGIFSSSSDLPFSAGNGSIISLKPCAFLIKEKGEDFKLLNVSDNSFDAIFSSLSNELINSFKGV